MDAETQHAQDHDFGNAHWVEMAAYNTAPHPLGDFQGFTFGSSPLMPMEPYIMPTMPQPYTPHHIGGEEAEAGAGEPLTMAPPWPSTLSTQPSYAPVPLAPMPIPASMSHLQNSVHRTQAPSPTAPRRTLSDADRRRMCMYHEEHPHVKQTEIGGGFCTFIDDDTDAMLTKSYSQPCLGWREGIYNYNPDESPVSMSGVLTDVSIVPFPRFCVKKKSISIPKMADGHR